MDNKRWTQEDIVWILWCKLFRVMFKSSMWVVADYRCCCFCSSTLCEWEEKKLYSASEFNDRGCSYSNSIRIWTSHLFEKEKASFFFFLFLLGNEWIKRIKKKEKGKEEKKNYVVRLNVCFQLIIIFFSFNDKAF